MVWTLCDFFSKGLLVAAVFALAACQAADGTTQAPDTALVHSLMAGLGAVDPKAKGIEYKQRAPLAMPAEGGSLPEPETKTAGVGSENWPQQRNNQQINALRARYEEQFDKQGIAKRLTPEQMGGFEISGVERPEVSSEQKSRIEREMDLIAGERLTPEEMKSSKETYNQLVKGSASDTPSSGLALKRKYLTEPPTAYSIPSADAPIPSADVEVTHKVSKDLLKDTNEKRLDPRCLDGQSQFCN